MDAFDSLAKISYDILKFFKAKKPREVLYKVK